MSNQQRTDSDHIRELERKNADDIAALERKFSIGSSKPRSDGTYAADDALLTQDEQIAALNKRFGGTGGR